MLSPFQSHLYCESEQLTSDSPHLSTRLFHTSPDHSWLDVAINNKQSTFHFCFATKGDPIKDSTSSIQLNPSSTNMLRSKHECSAHRLGLIIQRTSRSDDTKSTEIARIDGVDHKTNYIIIVA
ncbi:hypothetical protein Dimus_012586 [Dionaea muscipula]